MTKNRTKKSARLIFSCICILSASAFALADVKASQGSNGSQQKEDRLTNCESSTAFIDLLAQQTPIGETIIVIARLGKKESRQDLNNRRLHNVRVYLTEYIASGRRTPSTIILAEGEKAQDTGTVQFYVSGKLFGELKFKTNADLTLEECSHGPDVDPCSFPKQKQLFPCRSKPPNVFK